MMQRIGEMIGENLKKNDPLRRIGADRGGYWEVVGG
jgi:hypothetical protein